MFCSLFQSLSHVQVMGAQEMANITEPTAPEYFEFRNVGDAFTWAGFPMKDVANGTNVAGSLMALLDQSLESSLREVVALDLADVTAEFELWEVHAWCLPTLGRPRKSKACDYRDTHCRRRPVQEGRQRTV